MTTVKYLILSLLLMFMIGQAFAQSTKAMIQDIQGLLVERYIYLDKAEEINTKLDALLSEGHFEQATTNEELAEMITQEMRKITNDRHLGLLPPRRADVNAGREQNIMRNFTRYNRSMIDNFQFFDHNVAYFNMQYFGGGEHNYAKLDAVMGLVEAADALIIDLRYNGGGSIGTVNYMCSYFFEKEKLLSTIYTRHTDHTDEYWVRDVKNKKLIDVPVFILTSSRTFSGAEDFSYTLQSFDRATIVGETTRGGAHPTRSHPVGEGFRLRVPFARSIHPITKSNWEGTGIIPDVAIASEDALEKAKDLATQAAKDYKNSFFKPFEKVVRSIEQSGSNEAREEEVYHCLNRMVSSDILRENDINRLGYHYLSSQRGAVALAVLRANCMLYPNSPNTFDSYAEALAEQGENALALSNYKKAVAVAAKHNDENLSTYQQHLSSFKQRNP